MSYLTHAETKALKATARGDVAAIWSHTVLTHLEQRGLVTQHQLLKPDGRLAAAKRWTITDAGRVVLEVC